MAGTIPLSLTQQFDEFGKPLSGGLLYIYQAGTVSTPQNPYQDTNLSIVMPNPIPLDAAGRVPQFFLADGQIKVRLDDKNGLTQLSRDNILVIGPSAGGGGGGGSVDPTTILQTGMLAVFYGTGSVPGFVRANGRSIGNASSGATELAASSALALFQYLYNTDVNLPLRNSSGGIITRTGGDNTAAGAWANARQIDVPDARGCGISGLDDMGNSPAGRLTATYFNGKDPLGNAVAATVLGARGGSEGHLLTGPQSGIAAHDHAVFARDTGHGHAFANVAYRQAGGSGINFYTVAGPDGYIGLSVDAGPIVKSATAVIVVSSVNGGASDNKTAQATATAASQHNNTQPTLLATIYLKL